MKISNIVLLVCAVHIFNGCGQKDESTIGKKGTGDECDFLVIDVSNGPEADKYPVTHLKSVPENGWGQEYKTYKIVLRKIPAGEFSMGRKKWESCYQRVRITKPFYMGIFEITQAQWAQVMGLWDEDAVVGVPHFKGNPDVDRLRPMESLDFEMIRGERIPGEPTLQSFIGRIRRKTGLTDIDLPTEAQWEYACRAGTESDFNTGDDLTKDKYHAYEQCEALERAARYSYNSVTLSAEETSIESLIENNWTSRHSDIVNSSRPKAGAREGVAPVGTYPPNRWGLYDMIGNVGELCNDQLTNDERSTRQDVRVDPVGSGKELTVRGGSWLCRADYCTSWYFCSTYHIGGRRVWMDAGMRLMCLECPQR